MTVQFSEEAGRSRPGLGTNASSVTPYVPHVSAAAIRELRRDRFRRRSVSSQWLMDETKSLVGDDAELAVKAAPRPATCGWAAGSTIGVHKGESFARFSGVQSCASVWSCPCCGALIRSRRSEEVQQAAGWWEAQGKQFLFLTLTVRHAAEDTLQRTSDAVTAAFRAMINGAPWKRFARRHGIRHFIKAQEVTLGWKNGWHAHLHVLFFLDLEGAAADLARDAADAWDESEAYRLTHGRTHASKVKKAARRQDDAEEAARIARIGITQARHDEMKGWLFPRWREKVLDAGGREPDFEHGLKVQTVQNGNVVALYVAKLEEAKGQWAIGKEMSRNDIKKGRLDSLVPLELLDVDGLTEDELERNRAHWVEFVETMQGRRAMTWSRGLKDAAGINEVSDEEITEQELAEAVLDSLVITITARNWARIRNDADVIARILELVEADRIEEIAQFTAFDYPSPPPSNT